MSEEFNGTMTVENAGTGLVTFRAGGPQWATWYPDWPRFNIQNPGGNHTNTDQGAYYATSKVSTDGAGALALKCDLETSVAGLPYTAGMIQSLPFFTPKYGFFEARIRIVQRRIGLWPAWWMSSSAFDQWPPEIDIWEHFGDGSASNNTYLSNTYVPGSGSYPTYSDTESVTELQDWHVYGAEWRAGAVTFYRDGVQTATTALSPTQTNQYLIMNNGMSISRGTPFSTATVLVDYIRCWE